MGQRPKKGPYNSRLIYYGLVKTNRTHWSRLGNVHTDVWYLVICWTLDGFKSHLFTYCSSKPWYVYHKMKLLAKPPHIRLWVCRERAMGLTAVMRNVRKSGIRGIKKPFKTFPYTWDGDKQPRQHTKHDSATPFLMHSPHAICYFDNLDIFPCCLLQWRKNYR